MINEYFGVGVTSEAGMRSAGVEPWTGSPTDKHLPRSTAYTALNHALPNLFRFYWLGQYLLVD